ncbi:MAG: hypothetical protein BMS9Abin37_1805 [Acidobacteriota bacterium]|nr:MAG: hypothetical protein BMS9Abin37_1805 [Acidobacteriota bacterium]
MEKRLYFVIGDLFANAFVATVAVAMTAWLIGGSWGMIPGMLVGMVIGSVIAVLLSLGPLAPMFGFMEVIAPCMLSGMLGGMWGGMWPLAGAATLRWGTGTGLVVIVLVYALNALMTGPQKIGS